MTGLVREVPAGASSEVRWKHFDLREGAGAGLFDGVDVFVHAAYIAANQSRDAVKDNLEGTRALLRAARASGVSKAIFLSSLAASQHSRSIYGRQKYQIERLFDGPADAVVRAGLVIGCGGLFARMLRHVRSGAPVPIFGGGSQPLQTVYVDDLVEAVSRVVATDLAGTFVVAESTPVRYREFYAALGRRFGVKTRFIPVPFGVAESALAAAAFLKIPLPVDRDNLLGLKSMSVHDSQPDILRIGITIRSWDQSLTTLAAGLGPQ